MHKLIESTLFKKKQKKYTLNIDYVDLYACDVTDKKQLFLL